MIHMCLEEGNYRIRSVTEKDLNKIWEWYSDVETYKYATGLDGPIPFNLVKSKYQEACLSRWEYFGGIFEQDTNKMIGVVKGRIRYLLKDEAWISSLLIDKDYHGMGVGYSVITQLEEFLRENWHIKWVYTGVLNGNSEGMVFWQKKDYMRIRKTRYQIVLDGKPEDIIIMAKDLGESKGRKSKKMVL